MRLGFIIFSIKKFKITPHHRVWFGLPVPTNLCPREERKHLNNETFFLVDRGSNPGASSIAPWLLVGASLFWFSSKERYSKLVPKESKSSRHKRIRLSLVLLWFVISVTFKRSERNLKMNNCRSGERKRTLALKRLMVGYGRMKITCTHIAHTHKCTHT